MKLYYAPEYTAAGHNSETTRKAGWIADSLREDPIPRVHLLAPVPATPDELKTAHTSAYIDSFIKGQRNGDHLGVMDSGIGWSTGLVTAVLASTGGVLAAMGSALEDGVSGSLSSGLHHARTDGALGFCTINGLAVAARQAQLLGLADRILILDLDAHCGGGTFDILQHDDGIWLADVSTSSFDRWQSDCSRHTLMEVRNAPAYLVVVSHLLDELQALDFDLILYNAGMDPHEDCDIGGLDGITTDTLRRREQLVFHWCAQRQTPVAFVLAGGYIGSRLDRETLVELHRLTIEAAVNRRATVSVA